MLNEFAEHIRTIVATSRASTISYRLPSTIPSSVTDFVGREDEIGSLLKVFRSSSLQERKVQMACIRGMGGIGKTQLAFKVANSLKNDYYDGQILLTLQNEQGEPLSPESILRIILESFDPPIIVPARAKLEQLQRTLYSRLNRKRILILADNALLA